MSDVLNPMEVFKNEGPDVSEAFNGLIKAVSAQPGLNAKMRQLIYIGIKASQGDTTAVTAHVPMAKSAGVTREELRDTILMTTTVCGVRGVVSCLPEALYLYDSMK
jgi:alkylhydroperoxidase/carboxymuconolactone decarboxylase family protein YurZ